jgi:uncharacterized protein (TIGR02265 family)
MHAHAHRALPAPLVHRSSHAVSPELLASLFQGALSRRLTPRLMERLGEAGLDVAAAPVAAPHAQFGRWLQVTAESLYCGMDFPAAFRALGRETARGLSQSPAGWLLAAAGTFVGPARALERGARCEGLAGPGSLRTWEVSWRE